MTTPQQLDQLITNLQHGQPVSPQTAEEKLTVELLELATSFEIDSDFDENLIQRFTQPSIPPRKHFNRWLQWVATFVISILGMVMLVTTVPALRVLAEDIINEFFPRDTETHYAINQEDNRPAFDSDAYLYFETFDELQAGVDFKIKKPDLSDTYYQFEQGIFTIPRNTIQVGYSQPLTAENRFMNLKIRQQPLEATTIGVFYFTTEQDTISPEAQTTPVSIDGYRGEIVQGDWFTSDSASGNVYFVWSDNAPVYRLRWQDDLFLYEIELWMQNGETAVADMIGFAESMMD